MVDSDSFEAQYEWNGELSDPRVFNLQEASKAGKKNESDAKRVCANKWSAEA